MIPEIKKQDLDQYDLHLSKQFSKLSPEVGDGGGKYVSQDNNHDQKINELPIPKLTEILSKIDKKGEVPKQLELFEGRQNKEFEDKVKLIGLSRDSREIIDFLQSSFCQEVLVENKVKIHIRSRKIFYNNLDMNESVYCFFQQQENQSKRK